MKDISEREARYIVTPETDLVPDAGLGEFVTGYSQRGDRFNWKWLLWNILPFAGTFLFIFIVLGYWIKHIRYTRILIYKGGFVWQVVTHRGVVKCETKVQFADLKGLSVRRTRHYTSHYGIIDQYNYTGITLIALGTNNQIAFSENETYRNEHEVPEKNNHVNYALNAILRQWSPIVIDRVNAELHDKGFCTFYGINGHETQVSHSFIRDDSHYVAAGQFRYSMGDGCLRLYPQNEDGAKFKKQADIWAIELGALCDSNVFLTAVEQFFGIK